MVEPSWIGRAALLVVGMAAACAVGRLLVRADVATGRLPQAEPDAPDRELAAQGPRAEVSVAEPRPDAAGGRRRRPTPEAGRGDRAARAERAGLPGRARADGLGARADQGADPGLRRPAAEPPCSNGSGPSPGPTPDASSTPSPPSRPSPVDQLFEPKTDRLRPEARACSRPMRSLLGGPEAHDLGLEVVGPAEGPPVYRRASARDLEGPRARYLSLARTSRVRDPLAAEGRIDASRIAVTGGEGRASCRGGPRRLARRDRDSPSPGRPSAAIPAGADPAEAPGRRRGTTLDFGPERLA